MRVVAVSCGAVVAHLHAPAGLGRGRLDPRPRCGADEAPEAAPGDEAPEPPED
jgi:hypothetical protein